MNSITHTSTPDRLLRVVELLSRNKPKMDAYLDYSHFRPYDINIKRCVPDRRVEDVKRLLDLSFTTRQGGQTKKALEKYKKAEPRIYETLDFVLSILAGEGSAKSKYYGTLLTLLGIDEMEGIGQKIATMFLKFLVYYSDDFPGREAFIHELLIPFDAHVLRLLFAKVNEKEASGLKLYSDAVDQATLRYDFSMVQNVLEIKKNKLFTLQEHIREDFVSLGISEPPIILDYLWYVGAVHCNYSGVGFIGCKACFLQEECVTGKAL